MRLEAVGQLHAEGLRRRHDAYGRCGCIGLKVTRTENIFSVQIDVEVVPFISETRVEDGYGITVIVIGVIPVELVGIDGFHAGEDS